MDLEVNFIGFPDEYKYYIIVNLKTTHRTVQREINEILKKDKIWKKINKKYFININEDIFDNPEVTKFLDSIIGKNENFNYKMWYTYKENTLKKYFSIKKDTKKEDIGDYYYKNRIGISFKEPDFKLYRKYKYEIIKKVYHQNQSKIISNKAVGDKSNITITNTKDLVINFLDIIFNQHYDFHLSLIKCKNCGSYFLTTNSKVNYCDKLKCKEHKDITYNTGILEIDNFLEKFRTTYNKKRKDKNIKYAVFIKNLQKKYNYSFKEYGVELLSYYFDDNTRLNKIKEFNLQKYLPEEYLNSLKKQI